MVFAGREICCYSNDLQSTQVAFMTMLTKLLFLILILSSPAYGKDKESSPEKALRDEISEDRDRGQGRPDNPGQHGRDNAAEKQRENPGRGSKGGDAWESSKSDAFEDDDGNKNDKNKKNKSKKK